jgi:hypothetical protein
MQMMHIVALHAALTRPLIGRLATATVALLLLLLLLLQAIVLQQHIVTLLQPQPSFSCMQQKGRASGRITQHPQHATSSLAACKLYAHASGLKLIQISLTKFNPSAKGPSSYPAAVNVLLSAVEAGALLSQMMLLKAHRHHSVLRQGHACRQLSCWRLWQCSPGSPKKQMIGRNCVDGLECWMFLWCC